MPKYTVTWGSDSGQVRTFLFAPYLGGRRVDVRHGEPVELSAGEAASLAKKLTVKPVGSTPKDEE